MQPTVLQTSQEPVYVPQDQKSQGADLGASSIAAAKLSAVFSDPVALSQLGALLALGLGPKSQTLSLPEGNYVGEVVDGKQQAFCVIL